MSFGHSNHKVSLRACHMVTLPRSHNFIFDAVLTRCHLVTICTIIQYSCGEAKSLPHGHSATWSQFYFSCSFNKMSFGHSLDYIYVTRLRAYHMVTLATWSQFYFWWSFNKMSFGHSNHKVSLRAYHMVTLPRGHNFTIDAVLTRCHLVTVCMSIQYSWGEAKSLPHGHSCHLVTILF